LGREESARVLAKLDEHQLEELSTEIAGLGAIPAEISDAVVEDFYSFLAAGNGLDSRGRLQTVRNLLSASIGKARATDVAGPVIAKQDGHRHKNLSTETAGLGAFPAEISHPVAEDFYSYLAAGNGLGSRGGLQTVRDLLSASIGKEPATEIPHRVNANFVPAP